MVTQDPSSFLVVAPPEDIYLCALMAPVSALWISPCIVICLGGCTQNQESPSISVGGDVW